ncbi:hypothetical protein HELRODRAFT_75052 [Helobdella robusta]|uniref:Bicarbonate transporter-like transmembrane domain-containing protein n=1 Tax=Helobdella robusta TaxID=6412 RepID=T1G1Z8_HELRO|nr:hypothetical protein HELRODRAFT_75052 [Helobdella robusta]ESO08482.1 hypothetical protein HELRODRAFT_75052 [Helobdella robusta]
MHHAERTNERTKPQKIPMTDFTTEIRASVDLENFLAAETSLVLDVPASSLEAVVECLLRRTLHAHEMFTAAFQDAKKSLFIHDSGCLWLHCCVILSRSIQSRCKTSTGCYDYEQSWLCILGSLASIQRRNVAIARLKSPTNLGRTSQEVRFVVLVVAPTKEKGTKNALELGRTFSTLFSDTSLRQKLLAADGEFEFKQFLRQHQQQQQTEITTPSDSTKTTTTMFSQHVFHLFSRRKLTFCKGIKKDFLLRVPSYVSDFTDAFRSRHSIRKVISTTFFLYFVCLFPAIALSAVNYDVTGGYFDIKKALCSQTIGGLTFALVGGQPTIIIMTTAPLVLYTKIVFFISRDWDVDFETLFAWTSLWNAIFLLTYAFLDVAKCMKFSTRSIEEVFALFIAITMMSYAFKDVVHDFQSNYYSPVCKNLSSTSSSTSTKKSAKPFINIALPPTSTTISATVLETISATTLLCLLLTLAALWFSLFLFNFTKTPFLNASKRSLLADLSLPMGVVVVSIVGSFIFKDVKLTHVQMNNRPIVEIISQHAGTSWSVVLGAFVLGWLMSVLFFVNQTVVEGIVGSRENRLKKNQTLNWNLLIVAILNMLLALLGLPPVHPSLPQTPLHILALAELEERVDQGKVNQKIISVTETRLTSLLSHILIALTMMVIHVLFLIPRAVLNGLLLYLAVTIMMRKNQLFERLMLMVTEQASYPPTHYIRTVPQRRIHTFTSLQMLQLIILCLVALCGINYIQIFFPIVVLLMIPIRWVETLLRMTMIKRQWSGRCCLWEVNYMMTLIQCELLKLSAT